MGGLKVEDLHLESIRLSVFRLKKKIMLDIEVTCKRRKVHTGDIVYLRRVDKGFGGKARDIIPHVESKVSIIKLLLWYDLPRIRSE